MKNLLYLLLIAIATFCIVSCSKDKFPEPIIIPDAVTDLDGNSYDAVKIGNQVWMAENLRTKTIKTITGDTVAMQDHLSYGSYEPCLIYQYPNRDKNNEDLYGLQYSEYLVDEEIGYKICPDGWHLPDSLEWETLKAAIAEISGKKTKKIAAYLCGNTGWKKSHNINSGGNLNATGRNFTGFSALPAGIDGDEFGQEAIFLCRTSLPYGILNFPDYSNPVKAKNAMIYYDYSNVWISDEHGTDLNYGCRFMSVRCVKD